MIIRNYWAKRKVGEALNIQEAYLFWNIANELIEKEEYRIIQLSKGQDELWLEKMENKEAKMIRLLCKDIDWSNWMQRDIENIAANGERIRRQLGSRDMNIMNIYVSAFPPVDDYQDKVTEPFHHDKQKTKVQSILFNRTEADKSLSTLNGIFNGRLQLDFPQSENANENDVAVIKNNALGTASTKLKEEKALFDHGKPLFTYLFMIVQVIAFIWLEWKGGSTNTAVLIESGAKFNPLILEGEWWRFFTPIFLHIGLLHLLMNTLALFYLGTAVEKIYGKMRFLFIYILAGFSGTLLSFIFSPNVSAGASGAIFGCFGALLFFGLIYPKLFFRTIGFNILIVLGINLVFGFTVPGIDNAGHIGGLIGGFLATGILYFPKKRRPFIQLLFFVGAAAYILAGIAYGFNEPAKNEQSAVIMAQKYIQSEEFEKTIEVLADYADNSQGLPETYFLLSFAEIQLERMEEAKEHLHIAIDKNNRFHEAYYNLALVYFDETNLSEAKKYAAQAAELEPDVDDYQNLLEQIEQLE